MTRTIRSCLIIVGCLMLSWNDAAFGEEITAEQRASLSKAIDAIRESTAVTWTFQVYVRPRGGEEENTAIRPLGVPSNAAFKAPGHFREERYDPDGASRIVEVVDASAKRYMHFNVKDQNAYWVDKPMNVYQATHPYAAMANILADRPLEFIGNQEIEGRNVKVFRYIMPKRNTSLDLWIDAETDLLSGISSPGADVLDLSTVKKGDGAKRGGFKMVGYVRRIVDWAPKFEEKFFELAPPEGFELVESPPVPGRGGAVIQD
jgi:hypothetical protein